MHDTPGGQSLKEFSLKVADGTPAPAGGSVAAVCAALAAALTAMVGRVADRKTPGQAALSELVASAEALRIRLLALGSADEAAFGRVIAARRDQSGSETERETRRLSAWRDAARVPAEVVHCCRDVSLLARRATLDGPASTVPDAVMAALIAAAAAAGSHLNLRGNVEAAGRPGDLMVLRDQSEVFLRETQRAAADARLAGEARLFGRPGDPGSHARAEGGPA